MIDEFGRGLSVIISANVTEDWQAFATWYSVTKNIPDASIVLACARNKEVPYHLFQWAKRLNVKFLMHNRISENEVVAKLHLLLSLRNQNLVGDRILLMTPLDMVLDPLDDATLDVLDVELRTEDIGTLLGEQYAVEPKPLHEISPIFGQFREAKETTEPRPLISYKKGCGRWIDKLKGCPFSSAAGLVAEEMTVNEKKIIELWKRMVPIYSAVF